MLFDSKDDYDLGGSMELAQRQSNMPINEILKFL